MTAADDIDGFLEELLAEGGTTEELGALAGALAPADPSPGLRARVLATTARGRLYRFAAEVASLLDVSLERARELLDGVDDAASWQRALWPGVELYHLTGGPAVQHAITGFVRVSRGGAFPEHTHLGEERVLIVQGRLRESHEGRTLSPGEQARMSKGSTHLIEVLPGPALVYLVVVEGGIDVAGKVLVPGDPNI